MNGTSVTVSVSLGNPGPSWHAVATGDFNGDGHLRHSHSKQRREIVIWELPGGQMAGAFDVGNRRAGRHAIATGDLNGDGKSDILFQNDSGRNLRLGDGRPQHNQQ
jgi:serralysin